jgi:peptidoglycan/xylan/chitin deacetylase (PgdA/CDA1 family)
LELTIGITNFLPGWNIILNQIGVPIKETKADNPSDFENLPVLIVSKTQTPQGRDNLINYLNNGGCILTEADIASHLIDLELQKNHIKYLFDPEGPIFNNVNICDLDIKCSVDKKARYLKDQKGRKSTSLHSIGKGFLFILPSDFTDSILEKKIVRKNFPTQVQNAFPSERVSSVSKGSVRHIIYNSLRILFHKKDLPFLHLWNFPNNKQTIFSFRVDTDSASKSDIESLYQICKSNNISATWFVDVESRENYIDYFSMMENQEIGYHCYTHRIYSDYNSNYQDIARGLSVLKNTGIELKGYAAPFGEWNFQLGRLIEKMGFEYSSEFGCDYDDLPFFPYIGDQFSTTLQIPIHPISSRRLFLAKHNDQEMVEYYLQVMQQKLFLNEPIIVYHHPIHGHFEIFDQIFKKMNKRNIPNMNLYDFNWWWRRRLNTKWYVKYENDRFIFNPRNVDSSLSAFAHFPDGKKILIPLNNPTKQIQLETEVDSTFFYYNSKKLRGFKLPMLWDDIETSYGKLKH